MKILPILMVLFLVPAVAVWSAGCDDEGNDNGNVDASVPGNGGGGGDAGGGGTGGTDCINTGESGCDPDIGGFGECCDSPGAYCDSTGTCVDFT
jgi:hypothetical protein